MSSQRIVVYTIICCLFWSLLSASGSFVRADPAPVNLALGKTVSIHQPDAQFDAWKELPPYAYESDPSESGKLTDGVYGDPNNWKDFSKSYVFYRKGEREIVVDLGQIDTVNSLAIGFGQSNISTLLPPINVRFYVSNDGSDYRYLGKAEPDYPLYFAYTTALYGTHRKVYDLDRLADQTPLNVQARYVKFVFTNHIYGFADELEVMGHSGIVNGAVLPVSQPDTYNVNAYPAAGSEQAAGIRDQFLWYTGPMSGVNAEVTNWTKQKLKPLIGYMDMDGTYSDWMFDELLALPVVNMVTPSGANSDGSSRYVTKADMLSFLDYLFQSDTQLEAIDEAAGELNAQWNTDRKVKITIAIPLMEESSAFGDIDGTGTISLKPEDFASQVADPNSFAGQYEMASLAMDNKKRAIRWYIDEAMAKFQAADFDHLELSGFYWYHEKLLDKNTKIKGEVDLIREASVHTATYGMPLTWIPGYNGAHVWRDVGFSAASVQTGFSFNPSKKAAIPAIASLAHQTGASVELEYREYASFVPYLNSGVTEGFMTDAYNAYYMGSVALIDSAYSLTPLKANQYSGAASALNRTLYDRVYEYLKDDYSLRYTMTVAANVSNTADIPVTLKLPLANSYVSGAFDVLYDDSKTDYIGFDIPAALNGKGTFTVTASNGVAHVEFAIDDPGDAIFADLLAAKQPMNGAPDLLTLHFAKKPGVNDSDITARLFMTDASGELTDKDGRIYANWGASDFEPGSPEEAMARASDAVKRAEAQRTPASVAAAQMLVDALPASPNKTDFMTRLAAI